MLDTKKPQYYHVGGSVRDTLLGRHVNDLDFVVVGSTPKEMLRSGFTQVGSDFPVFLDDKGNEFALARTERKTGVGYNGFETEYDPSVTLEDDLFRRDLTVNSLAVRQEDWDEFKETKNPDLVVDPFNGMQDLKDGILRHVSDAFADDPVRVLRIARFVARYDFTVDEGTLKLMETLVKTGELNELTAERVWAELEKAVMENFPLKFFQVLSDVGAGDVLFPELFKNDKPIMIAEALDRSVLLFGDFIDRLIIICAGSNTENIQVMLERLKAPRTVKQTLKMSSIFINKILDHGNDFETAEEFVELLDEIHAWKLPTTFHKVMCVLIIFDNDYIHSIGFSFLKVFRAGCIAEFDMLTEEQQATLQGKEISKAIDEVRLQLVKDIF